MQIFHTYKPPTSSSLTPPPPSKNGLEPPMAPRVHAHSQKIPLQVACIFSRLQTNIRAERGCMCVLF